jgi:hypothetical protein
MAIFFNRLVNLLKWLILEPILRGPANYPSKEGPMSLIGKGGPEEKGRKHQENIE